MVLCVLIGLGIFIVKESIYLAFFALAISYLQGIIDGSKKLAKNKLLLILQAEYYHHKVVIMRIIMASKLVEILLLSREAQLFVG